jgi:hypothetical protein
MRSTLRSPRVYENLDFPKTPPKVHQYVAGSAVAKFWMSCRSMQECWDFQNRWYGEAVRSSYTISLKKSLTIRVITAPVFLATKLEAFKSRGREDYFGSHDLEDALSVIDGRAELLDEVRAAQPALREYLADEWGALVRDPRFVDALPGHLPPDPSSQARVSPLIRRCEAISQILGG